MEKRKSSKTPPSELVIKVHGCVWYVEPSIRSSSSWNSFSKRCHKHHLLAKEELWQGAAPRCARATIFDLDVFPVMRPDPAAGLLADVTPECFGIMLIGAELVWTVPMTNPAVICASAFTAHWAAAQHFVCTAPGYQTALLLPVLELAVSLLNIWFSGK